MFGENTGPGESLFNTEKGYEDVGVGLKSMNLPLSWFVYERIKLDLIDPRVLKIENGLHLKILESAPFTVRR